MDTSEQYKKSISNPLEPLEKVERVRWYEDPVYIKMADCPEIQDTWEPHRGDFLFDVDVWDKLSGEEPYGKVDIIGKSETASADAIWLPTQSQLQEMVADTIDCPSHSACAIFINTGHRIHQWCDEAWDYWMQFTSMEQLWLAFALKEKFGKVWYNGKWVVQT